MINIVVWSNNYVDIENKKYSITNQGDIAIFIKDLLDKAYYSGERLCLETAEINSELGKARFTELERWSNR